MSVSKKALLVSIEPWDSAVNKAMQQINQHDPSLLKNVHKIVVHSGGGAGQLGHVQSGPGQDPQAIHIFKDRVREHVMRNANATAKKTLTPQELEQAIIDGLTEVLAHESGHIGKVRPTSVPFFGEPEAEQTAKSLMSKIRPANQSFKLSKRAAETTIDLHGGEVDPKDKSWRKYAVRDKRLDGLEISLANNPEANGVLDGWFIVQRGRCRLQYVSKRSNGATEYKWAAIDQLVFPSGIKVAWQPTKKSHMSGGLSKQAKAIINLRGGRVESAIDSKNEGFDERLTGLKVRTTTWPDADAELTGNFYVRGPDDDLRLKVIYTGESSLGETYPQYVPLRYITLLSNIEITWEPDEKERLSLNSKSFNLSKRAGLDKLPIGSEEQIKTQPFFDEGTAELKKEAGASFEAFKRDVAVAKGVNLEEVYTKHLPALTAEENAEPDTLKRQYLIPRIEQYYMEGKSMRDILASGTGQIRKDAGTATYSSLTARVVGRLLHELKQVPVVMGSYVRRDFVLQHPVAMLVGPLIAAGVGAAGLTYYIYNWLKGIDGRAKDLAKAIYALDDFVAHATSASNDKALLAAAWKWREGFRQHFASFSDIKNMDKADPRLPGAIDGLFATAQWLDTYWEGPWISEQQRGIKGIAEFINKVSDAKETLRRQTGRPPISAAAASSCPISKRAENWDDEETTIKSVMPLNDMLNTHRRIIKEILDDNALKKKMWDYYEYKLKRKLRGHEEFRKLLHEDETFWDIARDMASKTASFKISKRAKLDKLPIAHDPVMWPNEILMDAIKQPELFGGDKAKFQKALEEASKRKLVKVEPKDIGKWIEHGWWMIWINGHPLGFTDSEANANLIRNSVINTFVRDGLTHSLGETIENNLYEIFSRFQEKISSSLYDSNNPQAQHEFFSSPDRAEKYDAETQKAEKELKSLITSKGPFYEKARKELMEKILRTSKAPEGITPSLESKIQGARPTEENAINAWDDVVGPGTTQEEFDEVKGKKFEKDFMKSFEEYKEGIEKFMGGIANKTIKKIKMISQDIDPSKLCDDKTASKKKVNEFILDAALVLDDIREQYLPYNSAAEPDLKFAAYVANNDRSNLVNHGLVLIKTANSNLLVPSFNEAAKYNRNILKDINNTKLYGPISQFSINFDDYELVVNLAKWQNDNELEITGKLDKDTIKKLGEMSASKSLPNNFAAVVPSQLYRGGLINDESQLQALKDLGIKRVVALHSNPDVSRLCNKMDVEYVPAYIENGEPSDLGRQVFGNSVSAFLLQKPTYIFCFHGRNRTGGVVARFRTESGWPCELAYKEAKSYGMSDSFVDLIDWFSEPCGKKPIDTDKIRKMMRGKEPYQNPEITPAEQDCCFPTPAPNDVPFEDSEPTSYPSYKSYITSVIPTSVSTVPLAVRSSLEVNAYEVRTQEDEEERDGIWDEDEEKIAAFINGLYETESELNCNQGLALEPIFDTETTGGTGVHS